MTSSEPRRFGRGRPLSPLLPRTCIGCGAHFSVTKAHRKQRYCGVRCARLATAASNRENNAINNAEQEARATARWDAAAAKQPPAAAPRGTYRDPASGCPHCPKGWLEFDSPARTYTCILCGHCYATAPQAPLAWLRFGEPRR